MPTIHELLRCLCLALGYTQASLGCCFGASLRWLEACLLNEEELFHSRFESIRNRGVDKLLENIQNAKEKRKRGGLLALEDVEAFDILTFIDNMILFQLPSEYPDLFHDFIGQTHIENISSLASSADILKSGGLSVVYKEPVIYNTDEISDYLYALGAVITEGMGHYQDPIGLILTNVDHAIALVYKPSVGWQCMEINSYGPERPQQQLVIDIAKKIKQAFTRDPRKPFVAFHVSVITTGNHPQKSNLTDRFLAYKSHHLPTREIALREDVIGLAYLAAKHGHADYISLLGYYGANLSRRDAYYVTPAHLAISNGFSNVLVQLASFGADLNVENCYGVTPAMLAAAMNRPEVIKILGAEHVNLEKGTSLGTPLFMAIAGGHMEALTALIAEGVNTDAILYFAVQANHARVICLLAELGFNLNALYQGMTAAFIAAMCGNFNVLLALQSHGADFNLGCNRSVIQWCELGALLGDETLSRMNLFIQSQLKLGMDPGAILIKPYDIAWILWQKKFISVTEVFEPGETSGCNGSSSASTELELSPKYIKSELEIPQKKQQNRKRTVQYFIEEVNSQDPAYYHAFEESVELPRKKLYLAE